MGRAALAAKGNDLLLQGGFEPVLYALPPSTDYPQDMLEQHAANILDMTARLGVEAVRTVSADELHSPLDDSKQPDCPFGKRLRPRQRPNFQLDLRLEMRRSLGIVVCNDAVDSCGPTPLLGPVNWVVGDVVSSSTCTQDGLAFSADNSARYDSRALDMFADMPACEDYYVPVAITLRTPEEPKSVKRGGHGSGLCYCSWHSTWYPNDETVRVNDQPSVLLDAVRKQFRLRQKSRTVEDYMTIKGEK